MSPHNQDHFEVQVGNPNLSPENQYPFTDRGILRGFFYHVNGLKIELDPKYIEFNETQAIQCCNGSGHEELCGPISANHHHPNIVIINSSSDNAVHQLTMEVEADNSSR